MSLHISLLTQAHVCVLNCVRRSVKGNQGDRGQPSQGRVRELHSLSMTITLPGARKHRDGGEAVIVDEIPPHSTLSPPPVPLPCTVEQCGKEGTDRRHRRGV